MNATKDHISLETAKLLKDCGVDSKYIFLEDYYYDKGWNIYKDWDCIGSNGHFYPFKKNEIKLNKLWEQYPAFTWQEIEENADRFFCKDKSTGFICVNGCEWNLDSIDMHLLEIWFRRRENKYDEADKYFRENCVFIK